LIEILNFSKALINKIFKPISKNFDILFFLTWFIVSETPMPKLPALHPYSDRASFDRLLLLIATLVRHPGIGSRRDKATKEQDSLEVLQQHLQAISTELGFSLPNGSVHTLRKDLVTLRKFGILNRNRHDWGYYLGTGAMNPEELQLALNALASQATYQGDAQARRVYATLEQRFRPLNLDSQGKLFYPVRAHFNRAIVHTDPEEMMHRQQHRDTLFHELASLENAIVQGLPIEIYLSRTPYQGKPAYRQIYPLQLLYHDVAWYLVMEDLENGHLAVSRVDRFKQHLKLLVPTGRGMAAQQQSLQIAHELLQNGWGLDLGTPEAQQQERQGTLPLITVKVRFFSPVSRFIQEGDRRHPRQRIRLGKLDETTGEAQYVDYTVPLPERSLEEFRRWVSRYMEHAQILSPPKLVEKQREAVRRLMARYGDS
jgi:predicted DNA-binding transcriptional regulator YafY